MLTKKTPTATEASWQAALARFDDWQLARGMGEKTRRAYGVDLAQLAEWAVRRATSDPHSLTHRELRHFAGVVSERGAMKSTVARKLAAIRTFYRHLVERGELEANPAELVSSPKKDSYLPKILKPAEVAELLDRIPGSTPLDLRDRALLELAYAAGLRAEELVNLDVRSLDADAEEVRVEGKGGRTRVVPVGEHAWKALDRYLARGRTVLNVGESEALFLSKTGRRLSTSDVRRRLRLQTRRAGITAAHPAALVRDTPAGGRRGPSRNPGAAGTLKYQYDPDIHSGRVETPQEGVRALSPTCVTQDPYGDKSQGDRAQGPLAPLQG